MRREDGMKTRATQSIQQSNQTSQATSSPEAPPERVRKTGNDAETLAAILEQKRFHRKRSPLVWTWTLLSPLLALGVIVNLTTGILPSWPFAVLCGFLIVTAYGLNRQADMLEEMQTAVLTADLDLCRPGPLAELLEWPHRRVRSVARLHLLRLLPALETRDAEHLGEEQRACLRHRLSVYNALVDSPFIGMILEALGVIGDTKALPYAEKLARGKALLLLPSGRRVRKAARTCLLRLESGPQKEAVATEERVIRAPGPETPSPSQEAADRMSVEALRRPESHPKMRLVFLIASWCVITPYLAVKAIRMFQMGHLPAGLGLALLALLSTQLYRLTLMTKQMRDARALVHTNDLRKVGALAHMLDWPDPQLRSIAVEALTRLLPQLRTRDAHLLNAKQRLSIYRMLDMAHAKAHTRFLESTLLSLQQIGDVEAIPYVERLANTTMTHSQQEDRVKQAAIACLPFLKIVAEQNQANQTLLRAAARDDPAPGSLLRPTPHDAQLDQAQLLRSSPPTPEP